MILALHGLGADRRQPLTLLEQDSQHAYQVVAPDLRGHGDNTLPEDDEHLTFDQLAADVEDLSQELSFTGPPFIIGISMGAAVAIQLIHRSKLPIAGALLIRPAWEWSPNPPNLAVFGDIARLLNSLGARDGRQAIHETDRYRQIETHSPAAAAALLTQFDDPKAEDRAARLTALPGSAPQRPSRPLKAPPVVVLGCDLDPVHPQPLARTVATDLAATFRLVPPRYEKPEAHRVTVNAAVRALVNHT
ncbi:MAG: alpha/beta hydrolase [Lapillicoccus sp.]